MTRFYTDPRGSNGSVGYSVNNGFQLNELKLTEAVSKSLQFFKRIVLPAHAHPTDLLIRSIRVDLLLLPLC